MPTSNRGLRPSEVSRWISIRVLLLRKRRKRDQRKRKRKRKEKERKGKGALSYATMRFISVGDVKLPVTACCNRKKEKSENPFIVRAKSNNGVHTVTAVGF